MNHRPLLLDSCAVFGAVLLTTACAADGADREPDFRTSEAAAELPGDADDRPTAADATECDTQLQDAAMAGLLPVAALTPDGVAPMPPSVSCEAIAQPVEGPMGEPITEGQATCSWKYAWAAGMSIDALEFFTWENEEGELECGCRCTLCDAADENPTEYDHTGEGTVAAPFEIYNHVQLQDLSLDPLGWDDHYVQCVDVDLQPHYDAGGDEFVIANAAEPFTGSYDGRNHELHGLQISSLYGSTTVGFFVRAVGASFRDLAITEPHIYAPETGAPWGSNVGTLLGEGTEVDLVGISVEGGAIGGDGLVGGIAGVLTSSHVEQCWSDVVITSGRTGGGLIGTVDDSTVTHVAAYGALLAGPTQGPGAGPIGGLIGTAHESEVSYCEAHGDVGTAESSHWMLAGLVGRSLETPISYCFATGDVTSTDRAGGLIAVADPVMVEWSYATGNVHAADPNWALGTAAGLVNLATWTEDDDISYVRNSFATGDVFGKVHAAGLLEAYSGYSDFQIDNVYASGDVTSVAAGPLVSSSPRPTAALVVSYGNGPTITDSFSYGFAETFPPGSVHNFASFDVDSSNFYNEDQPTGSWPSTTGQLPASGAAGHFQNPNEPPLSMDWPEGADSWDFSQALPTIPSAGM